MNVEQWAVLLWEAERDADPGGDFWPESWDYQLNKETWRAAGAMVAAEVDVLQGEIKQSHRDLAHLSEVLEETRTQLAEVTEGYEGLLADKGYLMDCLQQALKDGYDPYKAHPEDYRACHICGALPGTTHSSFCSASGWQKKRSVQCPDCGARLEKAGDRCACEVYGTL